MGTAGLIKIKVGDKIKIPGSRIIREVAEIYKTNDFFKPVGGDNWLSLDGFRHVTDEESDELAKR